MRGSWATTSGKGERPWLGLPLAPWASAKSLWQRRGMPRAEAQSTAKEHLYVLVHGFNSRAEHLQYMATEMQRRLGPEASIHLSRCNEAKIPNFLVHPTHDGVDGCGERCAHGHGHGHGHVHVCAFHRFHDVVIISRLAHEIREVVALPEHGTLRYISFLGNSMGGLFLRFAFGLLFDRGTGVRGGTSQRKHMRPRIWELAV